MKNTFKVIGLITVLLVIICGNVSAVNIVSNGDFEGGNVNNWAGATLTLSAAPDTVLNGTYSVKTITTLGASNDILASHVGFDSSGYAGVSCSFHDSETYCILNGNKLNYFSVNVVAPVGNNGYSGGCTFITRNVLNNTYTSDTNIRSQFTHTFNTTQQNLIKSFVFDCHSGGDTYPSPRTWFDNVVVDIIPATCNGTVDCGSGMYCDKNSLTCIPLIANLGSCGLAAECLSTYDCGTSCVSGFASYGVCSGTNDSQGKYVSSIISWCNNPLNSNHTWNNTMVSHTTYNNVNGQLTNATAGNVSLIGANFDVWDLALRAGGGGVVGAGVGGVIGVGVGLPIGCAVGAVATIWTDGGALAGCVVGGAAGGIIVGAGGSLIGGGAGSVVGAGSYVYDYFNPSGVSGFSMNNQTSTNLTFNSTTVLTSVAPLEAACGWSETLRINSNVPVSQSVPLRINYEKVYYGIATFTTLEGAPVTSYINYMGNETAFFHKNSVKAYVSQRCGGLINTFNASYDLRVYNQTIESDYYKRFELLVNYPYNVSCENFINVQWSVYDNETLLSQNNSNVFSGRNFTLAGANSFIFNTSGYYMKGVKVTSNNTFFTDVPLNNENTDLNVTAGYYNQYRVFGANNDSVVNENWLNNINDSVLYINYIFRNDYLNLTSTLNYSVYVGTNYSSDNLFRYTLVNLSGVEMKIFINTEYAVINHSGFLGFNLNTSYLNRRLSVIIAPASYLTIPISEITGAGDVLTNQIGITNPAIIPVLRAGETVVYDGITYNSSNVYIVNNYYTVDNNTRGYTTENITSGFTFMFPDLTPAPPVAASSALVYIILLVVLAVVLIYVFSNLKGGKSTGRRKR